MTKRQIYYSYFPYKKNSLELNFDNLLYQEKPILEFFETSSNEVYHSCPAWSHKAKRTFIIKSQMDITINLVNKGDNYSITSPNVDHRLFNDLVSLNYSPGQNIDSIFSFTFQLLTPQFTFWTRDKNIWMSVEPHQNTPFKNNCTSIGGWWNISNWRRPTSFACKIINPEKPIVIKRGDPLQKIQFYSNNLNDTYELINGKFSAKDSSRLEFLKTIVPFHTSNFIHSYQKESKCPFKFLWKDENVYSDEEV